MTAISGRTRLLALIADPVIQARSPAMANALLVALAHLRARAIRQTIVWRGVAGAEFSP